MRLIPNKERLLQLLRAGGARLLGHNWRAADRYLSDLLVQPDSALDAALAEKLAAKFPRQDVSPLQGKLLHLLARACRARTILEIGSLGGTVRSGLRALCLVMAA
jgi:predicted O-methyltransferase YrrM